MSPPSRVRASPRARCAPQARWALLVALAALAWLATGAANSARATAIDWADGSTGPTNPGADLGSASYSTWSIGDARITVRFLLPLADAQRIAGSDIEVLVQQRVGEYLLERLHVRQANVPCEAIDQGYDIGRVDPLTVAAGLYGFEIFFQCGSTPADGAAGLVIEDHALFDRMPQQVNFARVQLAGAAFRSELFTRVHQQLLVPPHAAPPTAGWSRYFGLGFTRMLARWDRLCFLLGAMLLMRGRRDGWPLGLGLAAGYALSLIASLGGELVPRGELLGAALGALTALTAAQLLVRQLARPQPAIIASVTIMLGLAALALLAHGRSPALLLAGTALFGGGLLGARELLAGGRLEAALLPAVFGFLDGFVLPEALAPQQLAARTLLPLTFSFDAGALIAALGAVMLLYLARSALASWPQTSGRASRALALDSATSLLGGLGIFWMLSRLHG